MDKTATAIVVNYDYYTKNAAVRDFVHGRADKASTVAFVPNPSKNHPDDNPYKHEWDVVISNAKENTDQVFKISALTALAKLSNVYPAVAVDNLDYDIYDEAGVLVILGDIWFG